MTAEKKIRDRCYEFRNIFAGKNRKNWRFLTQNTAKLCKNCLFLRKTPIFSPYINRPKITENCDHNIDPRSFGKPVPVHQKTAGKFEAGNGRKQSGRPHSGKSQTGNEKKKSGTEEKQETGSPEVLSREQFDVAVWANFLA
jgi:hypothetical protein